MNELPWPECKYGYTRAQLRVILDNNMGDFDTWMRGQTMTFCEGKSYNHDTRQYEEACGGVAHGIVVYPWDLQRYLDGGKVVD